MREDHLTMISALRKEGKEMLKGGGLNSEAVVEAALEK